MAHSSGILIVPDWTETGGVSIISPNGNTRHILANSVTPVRPNGIALEAQGNILLAHMGDSSGGIFRLTPSGELSCVVTTINGEPMPPANFVVKDLSGRIWITVSTRKTPRAADYRATANTGFIAVAEPGQSDATIVADNLGYTNECVIDESRSRVFVNETFGRRLRSFELEQTGFPKLSNSRVLCAFEAGTYPDGLALDATGNLWVTSIVSNRILRVAADGEATLVFEDSNHDHIAWTEAAYRADTLGREHLDNVKSMHVKNISNLAFGSPDLSRLYLGNLLGDRIPYIDTGDTGSVMAHWNVALGELEAYL